MKPDKPTSKERIEHVLEAILLIRNFIGNLDIEQFSSDHKTYSACLFQYTIIGEAIVHFDQDILGKYDYPWYKVKSFRNFILHEYHAIDARVVWDTTRYILPELEEVLITILENEF